MHRVFTNFSKHIAMLLGLEAFDECRLVITSSTSVDVTGSSIKIYTREGPMKTCGLVSTAIILFASFLPVSEKYVSNVEAIECSRIVSNYKFCRRIKTSSYRFQRYELFKSYPGFFFNILATS